MKNSDQSGDATAGELKQKIRELSLAQEWNHEYMLPGEVTTREHRVNSSGYNIYKWRRLKNILDDIGLTDKSVLDLGSSDGFFSIECARTGASSVLGIEADEIRVRRANWVKEVYGLSNVTFEHNDLYKSKISQHFDIVLVLGMLHRVPDIRKLLDIARRHGDTLILEYKTYDVNKDCCFDGQTQTKSNSFNALHNIPTNVYLENRLIELGFREIVFYLQETSHLVFKRTICVARK